MSRVARHLFLGALLLTSAGCLGERVTVVGAVRPHQTTLSPRAATVSLTPAQLGHTRDLAVAPPSRGVPMVKAQPQAITFPSSGGSVTQVRPLRLQNIGSRALEIERLALAGAGAFSVAPAIDTSWTLSATAPVLEFEPPLALAPNESLPLLVRHQRASPVAAVATLTVRTNDPTRERSLAVLLRAPAQQACMVLDPAEMVDFGALETGSCRTKLIEIHNCGATPLVIDEAALLHASSQTPFSFSWGGNGMQPAWVDQQLAAGARSKLQLEPGGRRDVALTYCPTKAALPGDADTAVLRASSVCGATASVTLLGIAQAPSCPKAVAGLMQIEAAHVGMTVKLTSHDSKPSVGVIKKWRWTLTRPPASTAQLWPSPHVSSPSLVVDVAGSYTFCVDVWDVSSAKSCDPGCLTVHATQAATYQSGSYGAGATW